MDLSKNCFVSWSGGKDSCLALYKAKEQGYTIKKLFTMFSEENQITSSHRLSEDIIFAQADAIGVESIIGKSSFYEYENIFVENLKKFKEKGIDYGIFGDIDIEEHGQWEEQVCEKASMMAVLPLWQRNRKELVMEFLELGFKAKIVVVNTSMIDEEFLGKDLSITLLHDIEKCGGDACGENGEYHTVVYDGPAFNHPVKLEFGKDLIRVGDTVAQINVSI